jgi:hypothetical protein
MDWLESERGKIFFKKVKKYLESVGRMISFAAPKSRDGEWGGKKGDTFSLRFWGEVFQV